MVEKIDLGNVKGKDGISISSIETIGTDDPQIDILRITLSNEEVFDYEITNNEYWNISDDIIDSNTALPTSRAVLYALDDLLDQTYTKNEIDLGFASRSHTHNKVDVEDFNVDLNPSANHTVDLDECTDVGFYYVIYNSMVKYVLHKPLDTSTSTSATVEQNPFNATSFFLMVEKGVYGGNDYAKQTWTSYRNENPRMFIRVLRGTAGWGDWKEVQVGNTSEFVESTHSASSNEWSGTLAKTNEVNKGTIIYYNLKVAPSSSSTSLNLTLPNGTETGAKNIVLVDGTNITNKYAQGSVIGMIYDGTQWMVISPMSSSVPSHNQATTTVKEATAFSAIGNSANATQHTVNELINNKLDTLEFTAQQNGNIVVDSSITESSTNPVRSSAIYTALNTHTHDYADLDLTENTTGNNIDFNDYTTKGQYWIWGAEQVNNTNKPPNDTRGGLLVVEDIPNGKLQILYNYYIADNKIYYRIYHNTAGWRSWKTLSIDGHTHNSNEIKSVLISADENNTVDLNNYQTTGFYYNNSNNQSQYISNLAENGKGFFLVVEDWGTDNYTKQTITHYGTAKTYVRVRTSANGWGNWNLVKYDTDNNHSFISETIIESTGSSATEYKHFDPNYYFNGNGDWTVTGEIMVSGGSARLEIAQYGVSGGKNCVCVGKNNADKLAFWWGTSASTESYKSYTTDDILVNTWYSFAIARRGEYITFNFNNIITYTVEPTFFTSTEWLTPRLYKYGANGISVRNLRIYPRQSSYSTFPCIDILANTDLNNITHQANGFYRCGTSEIASSLTNCPTQYPFNMVVYQMGSDTGNSSVRQEIRPYRVNSNDQVIYARNYYNGTWEAWKMYAPVSDTATDIKMNGTRSVGSNYTVARSDHVHPTDTSRASTSVVTTSANGLMSKSDKIKLNGIEDNANNYTLNVTYVNGVLRLE